MRLPFVTICIPSFNRPGQLLHLLRSVDCRVDDVEIVIAEDHGPSREETRANVEEFARESPYSVRYYENEFNLGFDGNIRRLVSLSKGEFVLFMGDDDLFVPKALDRYLTFLKEKQNKKYVLRSYYSVHPSGQIEHFKYLPKTRILAAGEQTVAWLFKRSVTISGFTISRKLAADWSTKDLDGTLLYQVYLMAMVCLEHDAIYCDFPVAQAVQSFREDKPMFGSALAERSRYTPGLVSQGNSLNFSAAYFEVTEYIDRLRGTNLTASVRVDLSKYSYPFLSIQRKRGIGSFLRYAGRLDKELGFGCTPYFYLYKWALVFLGEKVCDRLIILIKRLVGHTPSLR